MANIHDSDRHAARTWSGRCFVGPLFDYLLIGGGLSLIVIPCVYLMTQRDAMFGRASLPWIILIANSAHFAASSVRLYTKPGASTDLPFVSLGLPLAMLAVLLLGLVWPGSVGRWLQALYLTWSPYQYAAQAYGLSVMYCYRSGVELTLWQKRLLWGIALFPFVDVAITTFSHHVVFWVVPAEHLWPPPSWLQTLRRSADAIGWTGLVLVPVAGILLRGAFKLRIPLISLLVIGVNAVWFTLFSLIDGFVWATVFHGIQYLAIVSVFHVRDHCPESATRASRVWMAVRFYGLCVMIGYLLFNCLPPGFRALGFGAAESVLLVAAAVNIHHFIVDAYIWRLGKQDSNRRVVEAQSP